MNYLLLKKFGMRQIESMEDQKTEPHPQWFSIREAAEFLGVTEPTIYRWMRDKQITFRKIGDATRFLREDLDSVIQVHRSAKDADKVQTFCPICHHNELVEGRV